MPDPSATTSPADTSPPSASVDPPDPGPTTGFITSALTAPTAAPVVIEHPRPPRVGDMSVGWRIITAATWIGVILALAAVWNASIQLGLSTWWLGPRAEPRPRLVQISPFVAPVLMVLAAVNQVRWLPAFGLAAAAALAASGIADLDRVATLAAVELVVAAAAVAVSITSTVGVYRRAAHGRLSAAAGTTAAR